MFGIQGGHAAGSSGCDRLTVNFILHITCSDERRGARVAVATRRDLPVEGVIGNVAVVGHVDHMAIDARELLLVRGLSVDLALEVVAAPPVKRSAWGPSWGPQYTLVILLVAPR